MDSRTDVSGAWTCTTSASTSLPPVPGARFRPSRHRPGYLYACYRTSTVALVHCQDQRQDDERLASFPSWARRPHLLPAAQRPPAAINPCLQGKERPCRQKIDAVPSHPLGRLLVDVELPTLRAEFDQQRHFRTEQLQELRSSQGSPKRWQMGIRTGYQVARVLTLAASRPCRTSTPRCSGWQTGVRSLRALRRLDPMGAAGGAADDRAVAPLQYLAEFGQQTPFAVAMPGPSEGSGDRRAGA